MDDNLFKQEGYNLMGSAFEVYNEMGNGFLEEVYQECMERELLFHKIPFSSKFALTIFYKGKPLKKKYIPDLFVYNEIIIELKAVKQLNNEHQAQLLNYLKITKKRVGYLINFGSHEKLEWKRMVY